MANKKLLGTAASELRLPAKKAKGDKKHKWHAETGGKKAKEPVVVTPAQEEPPLASGPTELPVDATSPIAPEVEPAATGEVASTPDASNRRS